jgi:hypothetical protein
VNILSEGDNHLAPLDYSSLLNKILEVLSSQKPFQFSPDGGRLRINIDKIAYQVANSQVESPLASASGIRSATVNFSDRTGKNFPEQIRLIRDCLQNLLSAAIPQNTTIESAISQILTDLQSFQGTKPALGFTYPFGEYTGLQKQRLSLQRHRSGSDSLLKFHKLTITVKDIKGFDSQLSSSLDNYIQREFAEESESDLEDLSDTLEELIKNQKSDFYKLKRVIYTEAIGKLKREAKIRYLEFLQENIDDTTDGKIYLQDLIRRLRLLEEYISDINREDGHYQVSYAGKSVNYRDLFSRAEALDILPIIPLIEGYLGETKDDTKGEQQFIFGFKLKFGGTVQACGDEPLSVLDYYLNLIDPESQEHQAGLEDAFKSDYFKEKVLKIIFLYYFIFASRSNPLAKNYEESSELNYEPVSVFEQQVLPVLKGSDEEAKKKIFAKIKEGIEKFNVKIKIEKLKQLLKNFLQRKPIVNKREYPLVIGVKRGILERDMESILTKATFFKPVFGEKSREALKYIAIREPHIDSSYLCNLSVSIAVEDIRYFPTEERQTFSMAYDITDIKALPVLLVPFTEESCQNIYNNSFKHQKPILLIYDHKKLREEIFKTPDSPKAFVYRFTFSLLIYICLKVLLESVKDKLFIPIVRLQLNTKQNSTPEEEFMRSLSKTLSHLLSEEHQSSTQGFCVRNLNPYKIENGLSSLYSVLPKKFKFNASSGSPQLDKLAIIIVSSRESDASWRGGERISNLLGEVVGVERLQDGTVRLETLNTFAANYEHQQMFQRPTIVIDEVDKLYRQGYRHFMYIAKSPYSSTLNMTQSDEDESLFFMSTPVLKALKGDKDDIKIYPVFFDKYYVVNLGRTVSSLYIQDTLELTGLVEDPSKKAVVFFNLFNGIKIGQDDERYYNGVISYATLLNVYEEILDDEDIRRGLIYDRENNPIKNDILQYLTLFHFSRYEAVPRKNRNISFKLDPYENIIGDDAVGKLSVFKHTTRSVSFNSLAFLTEVRRALNVEGGEQK